MDDFGRNDNYGIKLLFGVIMGIVVILFLVPLGANIIANGVSESPANDAVNSLEIASNTVLIDVPINLNSFNFDLEQIGIISVMENNTNNTNNTAIIINANDINLSDVNQTNNATNTTNATESGNQNSMNNNVNNPENDKALDNNGENNDNTVKEETSQDMSSSVDGMRILSGSISTGSGLNDKSHCKVYVGSQYSGQNVLMSTLYSRDGSNLNAGRKVSKTVDSSGYISLTAAESYQEYPSNCVITIYDSQGNTLDSRSVSLEPTSGTQSF